MGTDEDYPGGFGDNLAKTGRGAVRKFDDFRKVEIPKGDPLLLTLRGGTRNFKGFNDVESAVINDAIELYNSDALDILRDAFESQIPARLNYNGMTIQFEPGLPSLEGYSAITISPHQLDPQTLQPLYETGFILGPRAFSTEEELKKTILQELHRINFSEVFNSGSINPSSANSTTRDAFQFAEDAFKNIE